MQQRESLMQELMQVRSELFTRHRLRRIAESHANEHADAVNSFLQDFETVLREKNHINRYFAPLFFFLPSLISRP